MINKHHALASGLLFWPGIVSAHSPIEGIDSFYGGLIHPVFVPAHLLFLISLGLFLGQQGTKQISSVIAAFFASSILGLVAAWFSIWSNGEIILVTGSAILGVMVAMNLAVGPHLCTILATAAGLLIGLDSTQETLSGKEKLVALLGCGVGINMLLVYAMGFAAHMKQKSWQKIGVRVAGSWVAASSLLVLALSLSRAI